MIKFYAVFFKNMNPFYIFADAIEIAEGIDFSHVEIVRVINDDWENAVTFGSIFPKSRKLMLSEMTKHYKIKMVVPLRISVSVEQADIILESLVGKPYSLVQIAVIGLKLVLECFKLMLPFKKVNLTKHLICTEYVGIFMQEACGYRFETAPDLLSVEETLQIAIYNLPKNEVE
jgi:hypothetical protein